MESNIFVLHNYCMAQEISQSDVSRTRELIFSLYRRFGELQRDEICCQDVTVPQCYTLQLLGREGEMAAGELAEGLGIDASTVTRGIDVLERRGSIERFRPEKGDRRRVLLRLTKAGRQLTETLNRQAGEAFERLLAQFSSKERTELIRALENLASVLDHLGGAACDPCGVTEKLRS